MRIAQALKASEVTISRTRGQRTFRDAIRWTPLRLSLRCRWRVGGLDILNELEASSLKDTRLIKTSVGLPGGDVMRIGPCTQKARQRTRTSKGLESFITQSFDPQGRPAHRVTRWFLAQKIGCHLRNPKSEATHKFVQWSSQLHNRFLIPQRLPTHRVTLRFLLKKDGCHLHSAHLLPAQLPQAPWRSLAG